MAAALPGLKEDIFALYEAILANFHVCAEYDLSSATPDFLALEYVGGHQTRVFGSALGIAVKMRSFFDIHRKNEALFDFLKALPAESKGKPLCRQAHPKARDLSLRDACNKIIHSLKVEFIPGHIESKRFDPPVTFTNEVPTEEVVLAGIYDSVPWVCTLNLLVFCSLAHELLRWVESNEVV
ncbi:MAG: hypothetical protein Q7T10_09515 [Rhodoferax sp.]|nr:hypothetical protein [Rhodoferax sp.]